MELTQAEFARWVGYTGEAVRKWVKSGMPHQRSGKRVVIETTEAIPWLISRARAEKVETAASERAKLDAERRRSLRRDNDIAEGELIPRADVIAAARQSSQVVASALDSIPGRVAGALADLDDPAQIMRLLKREIRAARSEIAAYADAL